MKNQTAQEFYDYTINHLQTQGAPAMNGRTCAYRVEVERQTADGLLTREIMTCAIGCHIPADDYRPSFETKTFDAVASRRAAMRDLLPREYGRKLAMAFALALQALHDDTSKNWTDDGSGLSESGQWRANLIARDFKLTPYFPNVSAVPLDED